MCVEDTLVTAKSTHEVVEILWFSLQQDQRAALLMMVLVLDQARLAVQMPDVDGDWDEYHMCQSSDSDSDFELYPDASNVDGNVEGVVPAQSTRDGGGGDSSGGGGSMERYVSVQHELRGMSLSLSLPAVQWYRPWHGYVSSVKLQDRQHSVLLKLRTHEGSTVRFRARTGN